MLADLGEVRAWRDRSSTATLLAAFPTRDERWLLVISWDASTERSSLARIALAGDAPQGDQTVPIFESERSVMLPLLPHHGSALLLREARSAPPGGDCTIGCSEARLSLLRDPARPDAVPLPEGLEWVAWAPDDSGVLGVLDEHIVYIAANAPERVQKLSAGQELVLPPRWRQ